MKLFKRRIATFLVAALVAGNLPVTEVNVVNATEPEIPAAVDHLIINQVYGGGGKGDTPITNSFIELYNPTDKAVSLEGYSIVCGNETQTLAVEKTIEAGKSYLIVCKAETTTDDYITYDLPAADQTWEYTISNKTYTITLKNGENEVDKAEAKQDVENLCISKQKSLRRKNYIDTDNDSDWEIVGWKKGDVTVDETYVNQYAPRNSASELGRVHVVSQPTDPIEPTEPTYTPVVAGDTKVTGYNNGKSTLDMEQIARYNSGALCADGGSLEIVEYNSTNGYAYAVSGLKGKIIAVKVSDIENGDKIANLTGTEYDVKTLVEGKKDFTYGDITSVSISPDGKKLAAAVQHSDYATAGMVAIFDCNTDGSLTNPTYVATGVQPDMVLFVDANTILTADEGEPRNGYGTDCIDPKGTVSIIDVAAETSVQADFESFTADQLTTKNIILGKPNSDGDIIAPVYDLEPEYIAASSDGKTAYVSLQEANAIAVLDLTQKKFTDIYSVGFEDYSNVAVDIVEDGKYEAKTYENLVGARMPDGIAVYENGGKTYVVTANEGDSREWGNKDNGTYYLNEKKTKDFTGKNIRILEPTLCAGLPDGKSVMFGGRGFTILEVTESGLQQVYDSENDFEKITGALIPNYFNCSNDDNSVDSRSPKKGPEPENVTVGNVNGKTYAFVAVERIGGIMVYDITNPAKASYVNYINSREFDTAIQGDVSPEGLCFVKNSKSGNPMLLAACEVSGTMPVYELKARSNTTDEDKKEPTTEDKPEQDTTEKPNDSTTEKQNENAATTENNGNASVGTVVTDTKTKANYKVTSSSIENKAVQYQKPTDTKAKKITIPSTVTLDGVTYKVTAVSEQAFLNNKKVTQVTVGKNVTTIGSKAFKGCKNLTKITLSSNTTTIGSNAFEGCSSLKSITMPSKVTKLGSNLFKSCKKLKTITIKTSKLTKKNISKNAFKGISSKATVKVPKKKVSSYKSMFRDRGLSKKVTVKKY